MKGTAKTAFFWCAMLLVVWAATELAAIFGLLLVDGELFSPEEARARILRQSTVSLERIPQQAEARLDLQWQDLVEVIHPYFGFVADPERSGDLPVSEFGFVSEGRPSPLTKRSPNRLVVAVFGGSFAYGVYASALASLRQTPGRGSRDVVLLNFAAGGYKQPQQVLILAFLLALGAEYDAVLNIDGFNEVALPPVENVAQGVNPFYPRRWHARTRGVADPEELRQVGRIEALKETRREWARVFAEWRLCWSPSLSLLWRSRDQALARAIYDRTQEVARSQGSTLRLTGRSLKALRRSPMPRHLVDTLEPLKDVRFSEQGAFLKAVEERIGPAPAVSFGTEILESTVRSSGAMSYVSRGPRYRFADQDALYHDLVDVWWRSSVQMKRLCETNGIRYYHFLQPNQYLEGSKPMGPQERRTAISEDYIYRPGAVAGYPLLRQAGERLRQMGIGFTDLSMALADHPEPLYVDDCCHLNDRGYGLIAARIWAALRSDGVVEAPLGPQP